MEDIDFISNLDWDPCYLTRIFDEDFNDMTELWEASYFVSDGEILKLNDFQVDVAKKEIYCPEVEDVSMEDEDLRCAVEHIEHQLMVKSEDVQYMKFDKDGNLFLYEPGGGMSGVPKRVIEFGSDEIIYEESGYSDDKKFEKFHSVSAAKVHRIIPNKESVVTRRCRDYNAPLHIESMSKLARKNFSEETVKKVTWVRRMFSQWRIQRNEDVPQEVILCDLDDHETITEDNLVFAMCRFIREIKKISGEQFPGKTLYEIIMCMQFHLESIGYMWKLLSDSLFVDLKFTLDNVMKERASENVGGPVRKAEVLSEVDVDILWENGIIGIDTPQKLLKAVFISIGMSCALRAGKEHQKLCSIPFKSQFSYHLDTSGNYYIKYVEDLGHKTNKGGLKNRNLTPKQVDIYPIEGSDRCPVMIIMRYLSLLPTARKCTSFYLQTKKRYSDECWFLDKPVGINKLQGMVCDICTDAKIPGYFTNHSLRATAATRLYHNDFDEQIIQEITGHRSLAVREYKRTSNTQKCEASGCIMGSQSLKRDAKRRKLSQ